MTDTTPSVHETLRRISEHETALASGDAARIRNTGESLLAWLGGIAKRAATERVRELFFADGKPAGVHLCTACDRIYSLPEHATRCGPNLCDCGAPRVENRTLCKTCLRRHEREQETARWATAKERAAAGYDDPVYVVTADGQEWGRHDGYFSGLDWILNSIESWRFDHPGEAPPELHVYAAKPRPMVFRADSLIESALDDHYEDAGDDIPPEGERVLQALLNAWIAAYGVTSYDPDTSTKIVGWEVASA